MSVALPTAPTAGVREADTLYIKGIELILSIKKKKSLPPVGGGSLFGLDYCEGRMTYPSKIKPSSISGVTEVSALLIADKVKLGVLPSGNLMTAPI